MDDKGRDCPSIPDSEEYEREGGTWQVGEELESEGDSVLSPPTMTPCLLHKLCMTAVFA